jgi:hypothetical protein
VGLCQQAYVYAVLPKKIVQFWLSAMNTVGVPAGHRKALVTVRVGCVPILGYKNDDNSK